MTLPEQGTRVHKHFRAILRKLDVARPKILEIGSWIGESIIAWDKAANASCVLVCVDLWEPYFESGDGHYKEMNDALRSGEAYKTFKERTTDAGLSNRLRFIKGDSRSILPKMNDAFDLVYIDGCHRYEFVKSDILNSMRLLKTGGILCGDDLNKQIASDKIEAHRSLAIATEDMSGDYHAGVTQAVAEIFGHVSCYDDLWIVRKRSGGEWESVEL